MCCENTPTGMVELVIPPYSSLLFENTSTGVKGTPQWSINNTAGYSSTEPGYGTPTGDATPVEGTEDGNYIYEIQGSQGAGVEGEDFVVSYPETASSVMVYNAAGMVVANYELPAGGQFVIPGSDFGPGMYIVKVYGENVVKTVKVVK